LKIQGLKTKLLANKRKKNLTGVLNAVELRLPKKANARKLNKQKSVKNPKVSCQPLPKREFQRDGYPGPPTEEAVLMSKWSLLSHKSQSLIQRKA
jgi:hypothetical protein